MATRVRLNQIKPRLTDRPAETHPPSDSTPLAAPVSIADTIELVAIEMLKAPKTALRHHPRKQIEELQSIIRSVGFLVPIVADEDNQVWSGIARLKAAQALGMSSVPVVRFKQLTDAQKRAFRLADNKLPEKGKWDRKQLAIELPELAPLLVAEGFDISITGFSAVEFDHITFDFEQNTPEPSDGFHEGLMTEALVSRQGDVFRLGDHVLACGDARDKELIRRLVGNRLAAMAFLDWPFNVYFRDIVGRGKTKHSEFAMASGEMSSEDYKRFLKDSAAVAAAVSLDSALHFLCIDWRHIDTVMHIGREVYATQVNLAVWVKPNGGQGSFYRSQHELIAVFRVGDETHLNNIELGRHGRSRTNVWQYAGVNGFRAGRMDDLKSHPTPKPVALVIDAMKDCTRRDDTVLDTFCGSGTTLLAAERIGRRAVCVEIEPRFVDLVIRRWQDLTGRDAVHVEEDCTFLELTSRRAAQ